MDALSTVAAMAFEAAEAHRHLQEALVQLAEAAQNSAEIQNYVATEKMLRRALETSLRASMEDAIVIKRLEAELSALQARVRAEEELLCALQARTRAAEEALRVQGTAESAPAPDAARAAECVSELSR